MHRSSLGVLKPLSMSSATFVYPNQHLFLYKNILKICIIINILLFNSSIECCRVHCKSTNLCCWCAISASWMAAWHHASYSLSVEFCCFPFIYLLLWAFLFSPAVAITLQDSFFSPCPSSLCPREHLCSCTRPRSLHLHLSFCHSSGVTLLPP